MPRPPLRKSLGQHHLRAPALCRPLIAFLEPAGQRVVEIGPGGGVLTTALVDAGARLFALELDPAWAAFLHRRFPHLPLVVSDALQFPWQRLKPPTLVAGNLPFRVATPLLEAILASAVTIPRAAFMLQKEVVDRLTASPGDAAYGALTVLTVARARCRRLGLVRPGSFLPPPRVAAAFVGFELLPPPLPESEMPDFTRLVRLAFGQRRKTLRNALAAGWGRELTARVLAAAGVEDRRRAQELPLESFLSLHRTFRLMSGKTSRDWSPKD